MPKALPQRKRNAILKDIKAGGVSRNYIARKHKVAASTVGAIAADAGITDAFDRTNTIKGARAKAIDCRALREQLKLDLMADAQRLRDRAWSQYSVVVGTHEGAEVVHLDLPPLPDVRSAYTAIGICADKSIRLEQHDSDDGGMSGVDAWLRGMLGETR